VRAQAKAGSRRSSARTSSISSIICGIASVDDGHLAGGARFDGGDGAGTFFGHGGKAVGDPAALVFASVLLTTSASVRENLEETALAVPSLRMFE